MRKSHRLHVWGLLIAVVLWSSGGSAAPSASEAGDPPRIVFLVNAEPDNYEADRTIPRFAQALHEARGYDCRVLEGQLPFERLRFPGLESLEQADLLVIFFRRSALAREQLDLIRRHLAAGKPLVGIRTANHAFSVRSEPAPGHEAWWEFVPEVLGCENRGYGKTEDGVDVTVATGQADHPILEGVTPLPWHSEGPLYRVAPLLDARATVLLLGSGGPAAGERVGTDEQVCNTLVANRAEHLDVMRIRRGTLRSRTRPASRPHNPARAKTLGIT